MPEKLFNLEVLFPTYRGYHVDIDLNFYSSKRNKDNPLLLKRPKKPKGYLYNDQLKLVIKESKEFQSYCQSLTGDNKVKETAQILNQSSYVVAIVSDNGTPQFSSNPKVHNSEAQARTEVTRLATANPGKTFAYFKFVSQATAAGIRWS